MEVLFGKNEVIQSWSRRYYEEILRSFSEIISEKLKKIYK